MLRFFFWSSIAFVLNFSGYWEGKNSCTFYINSLLNELSEHNFVICISGMKLSAPSFADDISLLVLYPTFLQHFIILLKSTA